MAKIERFSGPDRLHVAPCGIIRTKQKKGFCPSKFHCGGGRKLFGDQWRVPCMTGHVSRVKRVQRMRRAGGGGRSRVFWFIFPFLFG